MKILLVEDDVPVAELLADALEQDGHETTVTHSGEEALQRLQEARPDVVFLDLLLPGMSGIAVLERIRWIDQRLPVVLITGHPDPSRVQEARRFGVTDVIEKPFILKNYTDALLRVTGN